jgi:hypothetical protein
MSFSENEKCQGFRELLTIVIYSESEESFRSRELRVRFVEDTIQVNESGLNLEYCIWFC